MRTIDISGLVALRKLSEGWTVFVGVEGVLFSILYFRDGSASSPILLLGGILALLTGVVLYAGKVSNARILTATLVAFNVVFLALLPVIEVPSKVGALIVGLMFLAAFIYPAVVCARPHVRAAEQSPYRKIAFASKHGRRGSAHRSPSACSAVALVR